MSDVVVPILLVAFALAIVAGLVVAGRRGRSEAPPRSQARDGRQEAPSKGRGRKPAPVREKPTRPPAVVVERRPAQAPPRPSLQERLARSRRFLSDRLAEAFGGGVDVDTWDDIEAALIGADVGVETATKITTHLRGKAKERGVLDAEGLKALLADELVALFDGDRDRALVFAESAPSAWLVVGVNGTGKTTTIGKLASDLRERGRSVALAAADTFRAAADEQLAVWAERAGATLVKHQPGGDPGAVAFDAYQHAKARRIDVLIVDTAGRLHTKTPLMDELAKVRRVLERQGDVQEALLVIDATAGQNGLVQARQFAETAGVTGIVLTKLDGTAKGGIALAIENTLGIPIKLIGVGEGIDDLEPFDPKTFVDALLS
jgi:fused signal recognition particle receptor